MDKLQEIFKRQKQYIESLKSIERLNGFNPPDYPLDLDDRHNQEHLRLLAWRINEETYEALWEEDRRKKVEEIADITHFIVEFCIAVGFRPRGSLEESLSKVEALWSSRASLECLRMDLTHVMRCLRQRPWRVDFRFTPRIVFANAMSNLLKSFYGVVKSHNLTADDLYDAFFAKAKINDERQKSQQT